MFTTENKSLDKVLTLLGKLKSDLYIPLNTETAYTGTLNCSYILALTSVQRKLFSAIRNIQSSRADERSLSYWYLKEMVEILPITFLNVFNSMAMFPFQIQTQLIYVCFGRSLVTIRHLCCRDCFVTELWWHGDFFRFTALCDGNRRVIPWISLTHKEQMIRISYFLSSMLALAVKKQLLAGDSKNHDVHVTAMNT